MDQPVGQKSKARTFKVLRENGKVHTTVKKNNIHDKYEYIFTYSDH